MVEDDKQAINDLTRMALLYMQRGELDKAAELMSLAEKIEQRIRRENARSERQNRN